MREHLLPEKRALYEFQDEMDKSFSDILDIEMKLEERLAGYKGEKHLTYSEIVAGIRVYVGKFSPELVMALRNLKAKVLANVIGGIDQNVIEAYTLASMHEFAKDSYQKQKFKLLQYAMLNMIEFEKVINSIELTLDRRSHGVRKIK